MTAPTVATMAKLLLIATAVAYYIHAYWHNTMDFSDYRRRMKIPATNPVLKYIYINSFFLFAISCALFLVSVFIDVAQLKTRAVPWLFLAAATVLAIGVACVIPRPRLERWRRRRPR
jgi:hypothetical protein